jgi:hypothetical protein
VLVRRDLLASLQALAPPKWLGVHYEHPVCGVWTDRDKFVEVSKSLPNLPLVSRPRFADTVLTEKKVSSKDLGIRVHSLSNQRCRIDANRLNFEKQINFSVPLFIFSSYMILFISYTCCLLCLPVQSFIIYFYPCFYSAASFATIFIVFLVLSAICYLLNFVV